MPTSHAIISPSGMERTINCPPSARLNSAEPEKDTSYTREGTIAHGMAEALLKGSLKKEAREGRLFPWPDDVNELVKLGDTDLLKRYTEAEGENIDPEDMMLCIAEGYCRTVWETYLYMKAKDPNTILLVEVPLKLSEFIPEGFGTADAVIISGRTIIVFDLKYGKGVRVSATGNAQMMCYALGALYGPGELYDITEVKMVVVQPRLDHVSEWGVPSQFLLDWAEDELKPAAILAWEGKGNFKVGAHCRFCKVAPRCKALLNYAACLPEQKEGLLTDEELAETLKKAGTIKSWIANLEAYALDRAMNGNPVPGFKVVEGRSLRQIPDQTAAIDALKKSGLSEDSYLRPRELKTISDLEKLLTKKGFNTILGAYVVKPQGKPTLVEDSDPRPAMSSAKDDFSEYTK